MVVSLSPPPVVSCGVVGVWYCPPLPLWCGGGVVCMLGMYGMYGRSGMAWYVWSMYGRYAMYGMNGCYCVGGKYGM